MDPVGLIKRSLRCHLFGWLALIPLLGFGAALIALAHHRSVRIETGTAWNPAGAYARAGCILAWVGIGAFALAMAGFVPALLDRLY